MILKKLILFLRSENIVTMAYFNNTAEQFALLIETQLGNFSLSRDASRNYICTAVWRLNAAN